MAPAVTAVQVLTEAGTLAAFSGPGSVDPGQEGGDLPKKNFIDENWDDDARDEDGMGW